MAHREDTAQKYYRVFEKSKSSVRASQKLHGIMRSHGEDKSTPETYAANSQVDEDTTGCKPSDPATSSLTKRSPWKEDSLQAIWTFFQEEIVIKRISIYVVQKKKKARPSLYKEDPKRVYDRIRAEC